MKPKPKLSYDQRQRICGTKVSYSTVQEAQRYIREVSTPQNPLGYYRCPVCKGLHITSDL